MDFERAIDINHLVNKYQVEVIADKTTKPLTGINEIHSVREGDISFVDSPKYYEKVLASDSSYIIINKKDLEVPEGKCLLYHPNPFSVYNRLAMDEAPTKHSISAMISPDVQIGENTIIYPGVYIGANVKIGNNCIIYSNTTIYPNTTIGNNVIIQSNTAVGSEAFYYNVQNGKYVKMHTIGCTIIEDDVEIGSNCSIDTCESDVTKIGRGTKLDNQIHIGHGVQIGENCLLCAQVAIAGKTKIGNNVTLYGKVAVSKALTIGDNAVILATSNVGKDLEGNQRYFGSPAVEARLAMKHHAAIRMLPEIIQKMKYLFTEQETTLK